jgi:hypothetical protein
MINLKQHRNTESIWQFSNNFISSPSILIWNYVHIIDNILWFPRSWWLLRNIPKDIAETVSAHCTKVAIASDLAIKSWQVNVPVYMHSNTVLKWWTHDFCEWKGFDFTPHDIKNWVITKDWKKQKELSALEEYEVEYNDTLPKALWLDSVNNPDKADNQLIEQIDKLDAWVMALNYKSEWYEVSEFFPYTLKKLSIPILKEAYEWLLKEEFSKIDYFYQYCLFLHLKWNINDVRSELKNGII